MKRHNFIIIIITEHIFGFMPFNPRAFTYRGRIKK